MPPNTPAHLRRPRSPQRAPPAAPARSRYWKRPQRAAAAVVRSTAERGLDTHLGTGEGSAAEVPWGAGWEGRLGKQTRRPHQEIKSRN